MIWPTAVMPILGDLQDALDGSFDFGESGNISRAGQRHGVHLTFSQRGGGFPQSDRGEERQKCGNTAQGFPGVDNRTLYQTDTELETGWKAKAE